MVRIALAIEYDGRGFSGWQRQGELRTVQACVEAAVSHVANHSISVVCAGRTDSGVHALGQIIHFDTTAQRSFKAWVLGTNSQLPSDVCVHWAQEMPDTFHARFSAVSRHYRYKIYNDPIRPVLERGLVTWHPRLLNVNLMQEGANFLIGEHDFSSFRAKECQSKTAMRNVMFINISQEEKYILLDIKANAFLHHMVRNIVGVLLEIGEGKRSPRWAKEVLEARQRTSAGVTAKPDGLYLIKVDYP